MKHQGRILIVIIFGWSGLKLLFDQIFLAWLFLMGWRLHREGRFEGGCPSIDAFSPFGDVVVVIVVVFDELVERFSFLLAAELFLVEQGFDLTETRPI